MLVRVVRLFAGVVLIACLITVALFVHLWGWRSDVIHIGAGLPSHLKPLELTHRDSSLVPAAESDNPSTSGNDSGSVSPVVNQTLLLHTQPINISSPLVSPNTSSHSSATSHTAVNHTADSSDPLTSSPPPPVHSRPFSLRPDTHLIAMRHHVVQAINRSMGYDSLATPATSLMWSASITTHQTTHLTVVPSLQTSPTSQGYVLTVNYYEQQTMGLRNMMQLQCWAQSLKLHVVKPVMHDSFLRTPLDSNQQATFLKFEDSFDLQEWNHQAERLGYAPLVPLSEFLAQAPRDVVMVQFEHPSVSMVKIRQRSGQGIVHSPASLQYTTGCPSKWPSSSDLHFLRYNGFRVVRTVCFNFYYGDQLTLDTFNQHILAGHNPASVTVIMETWRGISSAQRVLLKNVCQNTALVQEHLSLSPHLTQQADQYIHKYLGGSRQYLAIMGRLEMTQLTVHKNVPVVPYCLEETLAQWQTLKRETRLEKTFLAIDIGRYGSKKYRSRLDPGLEMAFHKFFQTLFGSSLTVKEWERQFELIAGNRDAGYIGLLQKVLVTRAHCVLFVGGGAFQRHALYLYKQLHPNPRDQCYHIVKKCTHSSKLS